MPGPKPPYPMEFCGRLVELARSGRTARSLEEELQHSQMGEAVRPRCRPPQAWADDGCERAGRPRLQRGGSEWTLGGGHHLRANLGGVSLPGRRPRRLEPPGCWAMATGRRGESTTGTTAARTPCRLGPPVPRGEGEAVDGQREPQAINSLRVSPRAPLHLQPHESAHHPPTGKNEPPRLRRRRNVSFNPATGSRRSPERSTESGQLHRVL
jgi:hypothetical protein